MYATDPGGTWTNYEIGVQETGLLDAKGFNYVNGYYVAIMGLGTFYYSTTLTGTYTKKIAVSTGASGILNMHYEGGYYYIACDSNSVLCLLRSSTLDGTWSVVNEFTGYTGVNPGRFEKESDGSYTITNYNTGIVFRATSLDGAWTTHDINTTINMTNLQDVIKAGSYWIQTGMYNDGTRRTSIAYSTTGLGGTWSQSTLSYTNYDTNQNGMAVAFSPTSRELIAISSGRALVLTTDGLAFDPTDTAEQSLGVFEPPDMAVVCQIDLSFMSDLYTLEVRCYVKTSSGGTKRLLFTESFAGTQAEPVWQSIPVVNPYYVEFTAVTSSELPVPSGYYFVHETGGTT
jgi:hypothetical protein